jgi:hypothetical protein
METTYLFPETSSVYTMPDSTKHNVACHVPGAAKEVAKFECPRPFVNPIADDHIQSCIQPCPVQAYTDDEYTVMWTVANGVGLVGLFLNLFMACTWVIAGRRHFYKQPFQLRWCVLAGILFGIIATLPSLALKYSLACECETAEWFVRN